MSNQKNSTDEVVFDTVYPKVEIDEVTLDGAITLVNALKDGKSNIHVRLTLSKVFSNKGILQFHWLSGPDFSQDDALGEAIHVKDRAEANVLVPLELLQKASNNGGRAGVYYKYADPDSELHVTVHKPASIQDTSNGHSSNFPINVSGLKLDLKAPQPQARVVTKSDLEKGFHVFVPDYANKVAGQQISLHWKQHSPSIDFTVGPIIVASTDLSRDITFSLIKEDIKNPSKGDVELYYTVTEKGLTATSPVCTVSYGQSAVNIGGPIFLDNSTGTLDVSYLTQIDVEVPQSSGYATLNDVTVVLEGLNENGETVKKLEKFRSGTVTLPARFSFEKTQVIGSGVSVLKAHYYFDKDVNKVSPSTTVKVKNTTHSVAGTLYGAGKENDCNLGQADTSGDLRQLTKLTPEMKVKFLPYGSGRQSHSVIGEDGRLYCWGRNNWAETGTGNKDHSVERRQAQFANEAPDIVFVANGSYHTLALDTQGSLWAAGCNHDGRLTLGAHQDDRYIQFTKSSTDIKFSFVSAASCGGGDWDGHTSLGIGKDDGLLYGWGSSDKGVLGVGKDNVSAMSEPTKVNSLRQWQWVSHNYEIAAGITTDGDLYTWGQENWSGRLGHGNDGGKLTIPTILKVPSSDGSMVKFTKVFCGQEYMIALDTEGKVWGWGKNMKYALGQLSVEDKERNLPGLIPGLSGNIVDIAVGYGATAAVNKSGALYVWGNNDNGQLGIDSRQDKVQNPTIVNMGKTKFRRVSFGLDALFALGE